MDVVKQSEDHCMWTHIAASLVPALLQGSASLRVNICLQWWIGACNTNERISFDTGMVSDSQFGTDVRAN